MKGLITSLTVSSPHKFPIVYTNLDKIETTVVRYECCDLFSVLDKLYSHTLTDSGVGLFGLNATET